MCAVYRGQGNESSSRGTCEPQRRLDDNKKMEQTRKDENNVSQKSIGLDLQLLLCALGYTFVFPAAADGFEEGDHVVESCTLGLHELQFGREHGPLRI